MSAVLSEYMRIGSATKAFEHVARGMPELERFAAEIRLHGSARLPSKEELGSDRLVEFMRLVESGAERKADMLKSMTLFKKKLDSEIRTRNRFRAKAGSALTLTYMGMAFFFPLFSGISAIILTSSVGLADAAAKATGQSFIFVALLYALITLSLSSAFSHPEMDATNVLRGIAPYFILASVVAFATQSYLSGIL